MDIEELREFCLHKQGVSESFPFNEDTLVFKVGNKMFCLTNLDKPFTINLKSDPEKVVELREEYEDIHPGYHMNKKHWITLNCEGNLETDFIKNLIDESYNLVLANLSKKERNILKLDK